VLCSVDLDGHSSIEQSTREHAFLAGMMVRCSSFGGLEGDPSSGRFNKGGPVRWGSQLELANDQRERSSRSTWPSSVSSMVAGEGLREEREEDASICRRR